LLNDAGDLGAGEILALVGRSTLLPLRGKCDVVAFISEPDSMISPSEGVDGDLDLREAMMFEPTRARTTVGQSNQLVKRRWSSFEHRENNFG
jgi:hypothetical protein